MRHSQLFILAKLQLILISDFFFLSEQYCVQQSQNYSKTYLCTVSSIAEGI